MSTTEQRFDHLRFNAAASQTPAGSGTRYRLILLLAALAILVGWGLAHPSGGEGFGADRAASLATGADQQHRYDGHGKWGGYLPE